MSIARVLAFACCLVATSCVEADPSTDSEAALEAPPIESAIEGDLLTDWDAVVDATGAEQYLSRSAALQINCEHPGLRRCMMQCDNLNNAFAAMVDACPGTSCRHYRNDYETNLRIYNDCMGIRPRQ